MSGGRNLPFLLLLLLAVSGAAPAGAASPAEPLVGRIAAADGGTALRPAGGDWQPAEVNEPVAGGMALRTAVSGRAKLAIGADTVALAPDTTLQLGQLDAAVGLHLMLAEGRLGILIGAADPVHVIEIDTPQGQIWLRTAGEYDLTAGKAGRLAVFAGRARLIGKGGDATVAAGQATALSPGDPLLTAIDGAAPDAFAHWWRPATAATPASSAGSAQLSPDMTGRALLADHGSWQTIAGYGAVWFPKTVPSDWAPYRFGHWRWLPPWGWTWIDDADWGFAPSHYGRWARVQSAAEDGARWGWVPGQPVAAPLFMPAAVAFIGTAGVGISYPDSSGPAVGWFPLAPGEVYWPHYTSDLATIRRLNQGSVQDAAAIGPHAAGVPPAAVLDAAYRNRDFASVVPRAVFVGGKPVAPALVRLPEERLKNAPVLAGSPDIAPPAARATAVAAAAPAARRATAGPMLARILRSRQRVVNVRWKARWRAHRLHRERLRLTRAAYRRGGRRHISLAAYRRRR